jgi:hypothetical protein
MTRPLLVSFGLILSLILFLRSTPPATGQTLPELPLNGAQPTTVLVRVVAHGAMLLGRQVGGAHVTITDVASGHILPQACSKVRPATRTRSCVLPT